MPIPFFPKSDAGDGTKQLSEQTHTLLRQMAVPLFITDRTGKIIFCNRACCVFLAAEETDLLGTEVKKWGLPIGDVFSLEQKLAGSTFSSSLLTKDEKTVSARIQINALAGEGRFLFVLEKQDISSFGKVLQKALQAYPQAILLQTVEGVCVFCNKQAEKLFAVKAENVKTNWCIRFCPKN